MQVLTLNIYTECLDKIVNELFVTEYLDQAVVVLLSALAMLQCVTGVNSTFTWRPINVKPVVTIARVICHLMDPCVAMTMVSVCWVVKMATMDYVVTNSVASVVR